MSKSPAQREAWTAHAKRREAAGLRRVTVWLNAETRERLRKLADAADCSQDATVAEALLRLWVDDGLDGA